MSILGWSIDLFPQPEVSDYAPVDPFWSYEPDELVGQAVRYEYDSAGYSRETIGIVCEWKEKWGDVWFLIEPVWPGVAKWRRADQITGIE